jgi:hypothetical protein
MNFITSGAQSYQGLGARDLPSLLGYEERCGDIAIAVSKGEMIE